jgi:PIN domain nuclease of toxin-antitoxin system
LSYLVDTHILLWWLSDDKKLKEKARKVLSEKSVWVSSAAAWEIVIKAELGKLSVPGNLDEILVQQEMNVLDIKLPHVLRLYSLENHHSDPFDRIQIAQAIYEGLTFITYDEQIKKYSGLDLLDE